MVRVRPGCTQTTEMPDGASSSARFFVSAATPTLRIEPIVEPVLSAARPEMLIMRPPPRSHKGDRAVARGFASAERISDIADRAARSRALFAKAAKVITSPRCMR
jgi:hypothetical protein